jgi:8-oxo-dGTP pyrophosphatase MutT (NUDIX family)
VTSQPDPPFVRPRVAAGVLFLDDTDQVLLVVPSYKDFLDLPGGYVEPGESPRAAARREVREELAIEPSVGRLLVADWWLDSADGQGGEKLLFVFAGDHLTPTQLAAVAVDGEEVVGYRFHPVADLGTVTIPRLANRIRHAVAAHHAGTTRYLEDGQPADPAAAPRTDPVR